MNNIHAPTIPSGPSTTQRNGTNGGPVTLASLEQQKNDIESELRALSHVLDSHGVTMDTPLISRDGFPRSDIDVAQVRTTRHRIICLRNDYKDVMSRIEVFIHEQFANMGTPSSEPTNNEVVNDTPIAVDQQPLRDFVPVDTRNAFAKVNTVSDNSPASDSGLQPGDYIVKFGYVSINNHDNLRKVGECVQANENQDIPVTVVRGPTISRLEEVSLVLRPRRDWGGRGTLGCHIIPLN